MAKNFSKKKQNTQAGLYKNTDSNLSYNPQKKSSVNRDEWEKFIEYYRYHIDEFAINVLGLHLYPFQRLMLRAMARYQFSMLICARGLGKR